MFTLHTDPSHGWLEVTSKDLKIVGVDISTLSSFSYRSEDSKSFYLEEDCDAGVFVEAYVSHFGKKPEVEEKYQEDTFIRRLPCIGWDPYDGEVEVVIVPAHIRGIFT